MKTSKSKFFSIILLAINALLAVFVVANLTYSIVRGTYTIQDAGMFVETQEYDGQTHTYKCYRIKDQETKTYVVLIFAIIFIVVACLFYMKNIQ